MREHIDNSILTKISNTKIIAVGVSDYRYLPKLTGTLKDLEDFTQLLVFNENTALYPENNLSTLKNPDSNELRNTLTEYVHSRSARGDILIFYFSGHGYVSGSGNFNLCLTDAKTGFDNSGVIPLSTLPFIEIIKSLSAVDVYPCFILDACFSAASTKVGHININEKIEEEIEELQGSSYAILASSSPDAHSKETADGGFFTQAICEAIKTGRASDQNDPHISLQNFSNTFSENLSLIGAPLPRLHVGTMFPEIAIAINPAFRPNIRTERFTKSYIDLLKYAWNNGDPLCLPLAEIRKGLATWYSNHRKFEYIWGLLEDCQLPNGKRGRRLTQKGIDFLEGKVKIYRKMQQDPQNLNRWIPTKDSKQISCKDI